MRTEKSLIVDDGDIIVMTVRKFIPFPSEAWMEHFADVRKFFIVRSVNNNGTLKLIDSRGRLTWAHMSRVDRIAKKYYERKKEA